MGFETSVVVAIFFISALVLGTTSYTVVSASRDMVNDAAEDQYEIQNKRLQTDISITDSTANGPSASYDLTITLTNTGSETLNSSSLNVLIDGAIESYTPSPSTTTWTPDETKTLEIIGLSGAGSHRVKVITENGISDYDTYSV
jgi:flagellar protein FlaF